MNPVGWKRTPCSQWVFVRCYMYNWLEILAKVYGKSKFPLPFHCQYTNTILHKSGKKNWICVPLFIAILLFKDIIHVFTDSLMQ